jgi:hypothetical protein
LPLVLAGSGGGEAMGKWGDLGRLYYSRAVTLCERLPVLIC